MPIIKYLYEKYLQGTITDEEKQKLFDLIRNADEATLAKLADEYLYSANKKQFPDLAQDGDRLFKGIEERIFAEGKESPKTIRLWKVLPYAAAIALIAVIAFFYSNRQTQKAISGISVALADVKPGGKQAILSMADGRRINLDSARSGELAYLDGIRISKTDNGKLVYENSLLGTSRQQNTISVPRAGEYELFLPDGTHVWLNSATTIEFPTRFTGSQRVVSVSGEAYFEVAKDALHPFVVKTERQSITVLGTHFNVNTYALDRTVTTLAEGSVKVVGNGKTATIKPGEQTVFSEGALTVSPADLESSLGWKNGLLSFRDEPVKNVLDEVSRWYDVDIEYSRSVPEKVLTGDVKRTANLSAMLRILKLTGVKTRLVSAEGKKKLVVE